MNDLSNLKALLESGIITNDEYETIIKRLEKHDKNYQETWGDIVENFYEWCLGNYSVTTAKGYKTCLYKFILYLTKEETNIEAFKHEFKTYSFVAVNNFLNKMESDNFSSQAINKTKYAIAVLGNYLASKDIKVPDISKIKISIQKEVNNTTIAITQDEILSIVNVSDLRSKVCILLAYEGCLRRVELSRVKISDFNFDDKQLFVYDNDNKVDRVCILSSDTIAIVKNYIDELYKDIEKWNNNRVLKGKPVREDLGYLFQNVRMTVPSYSLLQKMLKESATKYYGTIYEDEAIVSEKCSNFTFESIRNSRKVYLLAQGVPVNDVMQMCGDKNYMSTYRFSKLVPALYPNSIRTI